jgi:hypothetical protein
MAKRWRQVGALGPASSQSAAAAIASPTAVFAFITTSLDMTSLRCGVFTNIHAPRTMKAVIETPRATPRLSQRAGLGGQFAVSVLKRGAFRS